MHLTPFATSRRDPCGALNRAAAPSCRGPLGGWGETTPKPNFTTLGIPTSATCYCWSNVVSEPEVMIRQSKITSERCHVRPADFDKINKGLRETLLYAYILIHALLGLQDFHHHLLLQSTGGRVSICCGTLVAGSGTVLSFEPQTVAAGRGHSVLLAARARL